MNTKYIETTLNFIAIGILAYWLINKMNHTIGNDLLVYITIFVSSVSQFLKEKRQKSTIKELQNELSNLKAKQNNE